MQYSKEGLQLTESFESCRLTAYHGSADRPGVWSIGWGHVGPEVVEGLVWTQSQADTQLIMDLQHAEHAVNTLVTVPMVQGVFDALVDFCYNCGVGAFTGSTLLKLLNAGDMENASLEFNKWAHAGGKVVAGLLRRRQAETDEFRKAT